MFIKSIHFIDEGVTAYKKNQVLNVIVLANGVIEDLGDPVTIVKWINLAHFHTISSHTQTLTPVILFFNQKKPKKKHSRKVSCKQTHIFSMIFTIFFFFFFFFCVMLFFCVRPIQASRTRSYTISSQNSNPHSSNTFFNQKNIVKKGNTGRNFTFFYDTFSFKFLFLVHDRQNYRTTLYNPKLNLNLLSSNTLFT